LLSSVRDNELAELEEQFEKLSTTKLADGTSGQGSHIPLEVFQRRFLPNDPELSSRLFKAFDFDVHSIYYICVLCPPRRLNGFVLKNDGKINQYDFLTGMANCRSPAEVRERCAPI